MTRPATFEFHVSRRARQRYGFDDALFSITGNVVFADFAASRAFAQRMNVVRDAERNPSSAVAPATLHAMGLIDELLHAVVAAYRRERDPRAMIDALGWFEARLGREALDRTLRTFAEEFPTVAVHRGRLSAAAWLAESSGDVPNRAVALEEMTLLWLSNRNPAFGRFAELFEETPLAATTAYRPITDGLREYFETRPRFGPENQNLVDLLRAPALASPDDLAGQLAFIRDRWGSLLRDVLRRLLAALDVLKEEEIAAWLRFHPGGRFGGGPPPLGDSGAGAILRFGAGEQEYERFSADLEWMPRAVMMAKSVFVWLHQLSSAYGRHIHRLDQIPDEELDRLARRGFNTLWLIGVWERSRASQRIKQLCGDPDAAASAYSLHDYVIAADLGGEGACAGLRQRAAARGIRLASDMVPNHTGVDSRWVIEHPDWFLSLPYSPYPAYRFDGPDLSSDGRVEIKVEDRYFDRTDAAVVFRRVDRWTGDTRYIYHGNDGTSMPWNDTAQLDYRKPEVREAVIQTILHVARQFPAIRFDAAMTLTKRHFQRLWFPEPGSGGAIPSRAEHGLTKAEFDATMPAEFWREVVDRVAAEAPGTLLLAEAFWLLEGYFVRTLGMHRVYNSAFMNMLRDEENANYRSVIKNTLEFDPEVLKRYVNFMSNPDERTAVDQFGKGDKYFGICTLMATMPGLPMFGHGQIEGFTEKYGMEFRRAHRDEQPDPWLVARHEREISPLLHRRALFAEVRDFLLYDVFTDDGHVNEDVFAYSNRRGEERGLVIYHNRYADTRGWIRSSCAYAEKAPDGGRHLRQRSLGESFGLSRDPAAYVGFRDAVTGLEHLHRAADLAARGLRIELGAYRCHVFLDWRDLRDDGSGAWGALCDALMGRGVPSLGDALRELAQRPVHQALRGLLEPALAGAFAAASAAGAAGGGQSTAPVEEAVRRMRSLLEASRLYASSAGAVAVGLGPDRAWSGHDADALDAFRGRITAAVRIPELEARFSEPWPADARAVLPSIAGGDTSLAPWNAVLAFAAVECLGGAADARDPDAASVRLFDALRLREPIADVLETAGVADDERWRSAARVRAAFAHAAWAPESRTADARRGPYLDWLGDPDVAWLLGVHEHEGVRYFGREHYERLQWWLALRRLLALAETDTPARTRVATLEQVLRARAAHAQAAGYRVEALLDECRAPRTRAGGSA
jgi:glycosidase